MAQEIVILTDTAVPVDGCNEMDHQTATSMGSFPKCR